MQYVFCVLVAVAVVFAFLQMGGSNGAGRRPRRIDHDRMNRMLTQARISLELQKLDEAEGQYSQALNYARSGDVPVHVAESYYGLALVQEKRSLFREAVHMVDLAIRAIEPHRADFENYYSLLTRFKEELSARIKN